MKTPSTCDRSALPPIEPGEVPVYMQGYYVYEPGQVLDEPSMIEEAQARDNNEMQKRP
jgi:hypothetical protein